MYRSREQYDLALEAYEDAMQLCMEQPDLGIGHAYTHLTRQNKAEVLDTMGERDKARKFLEVC